jgi:hypothetical protein
MLSIMRTNYAGNTWHAPNVDIHHALLGRIGGGIAYIGVVCRSDWGFGLTGGLSGSFTSMGQPVVWDMKGFMHEVSCVRSTKQNACMLIGLAAS